MCGSVRLLYCCSMSRSTLNSEGEAVGRLAGPACATVKIGGKNQGLNSYKLIICAHGAYGLAMNVDRGTHTRGRVGGVATGATCDAFPASVQQQSQMILNFWVHAPAFGYLQPNITWKPGIYAKIWASPRCIPRHCQHAEALPSSCRPRAMVRVQ